MRREPWAAIGLLLFSTPAFAASYAALEERPVTGGELRLNEPVFIEEGQPPVTAFGLERTEVLARVSGMMAHVTVEQVFKNPLSRSVEAVYVFPMAVDAAVNSYEIMIGERVVKGRLKEIEKAREAFRRARARGQTAALLESQKPNVFQQSLANIPPRAEVRVRLSYVEGLAYQDGGYELVFPMTVAPRYLPAGTRDPSPVRKTGRLPAVSLSVHLDSGVPLGAVHSPSHNIQVTSLDDTRRLVRLAYDEGRAVDDRDFVLRYRTGGERTFAGFLAHREGDEGFFNLIIQPKARYVEGDVRAREVILLIDRSCSMNGPPIGQARRVARAVIDALGPRDALSVISFADSATMLSQGPLPVTSQTRQEAKRFVEQLRVGGGTRLLEGVAKALRRPAQDDRLRMVYVLTDGAVGNDDEILGAVRRHAGHNRIFPVGLSQAPNRYLLDRLAAEGRGFSTYIAPGQPAKAPLEALIQKTRHPYLTDLQIDWGGLSVLEPLPGVVPDVYADRPLLLTGRYSRPGRGTITLRGYARGEPVSLPIEVELPARQSHPGLPMLWARRRLDQLMSEDYERRRPDVRAKIVRLGLAFNVVTPYTAFVAIDEGVERGMLLSAAEPAETAEDAPALSQASPAPPPQPVAQADSPPRPYRRRRYSGGGGGDVDPITLTTILSTVPLAWRLRRRRRKDEPAQV